MSIASTAPRARRPPHAGRVAIISAVAALHVALIGMVVKREGAPRAGVPGPRTAMLLVEPAPQRPRPVTPLPLSPPPPSAAVRRSARQPPSAVSRPGRLPATLSEAAPPSVAPDVLPSAEPATGLATHPQRSVLDARVIQRAVREVAGASVFEQHAAQAGRDGRPSSAGESRLASGMAAAAHGDCLKGDFRGRDMGLLSLPMLALAAAEGRCASR